MANKDLFVVCLKQKHFVIIKKEWIANPSVGVMTNIFYSPNENAISDFNIASKYYFNKEITACYEGYIQKSFDSLEKAKKFIGWKRPTIPGVENDQNFNEPVDLIDLLSDEVSNIYNCKIIDLNLYEFFFFLSSTTVI